MRHLGSVLLSIVLAPVIYVLTGIGTVKLLAQLARFDTRFSVTLLVGLVTLLAAGGLYALLAQARLSPIGPVLAGLAYLVFGILGLVTSWLPAKLPHAVFGVPGAAQEPLAGITLLLAVPLLLTAVS